jgi:hypothetical protein
MKVQKTLTPVKSTAGTHVYGEPPAEPNKIFPALYLPKSLFPNGPTPTVTVTVEIPE